jgi:hypothetical protein
MLQRGSIDVVAYGSSLHDEDSYYLVRRYDSLAQREAILALIENYTEIVLELDEVTVQSWRRGWQRRGDLSAS